MRTPARTSRFLGVRLSEEEERRLEEFRQTRGLPTTSEAVRELVRSSANPRAGSIELPVSLRGEIDTLVEDGYAANPEAALTMVLSLGFSELGRTYESLTRFRAGARGAAQRRQDRQRMEREGRGLLGQ